MERSDVIIGRLCCVETARKCVQAMAVRERSARCHGYRRQQQQQRKQGLAEVEGSKDGAADRGGGGGDGVGVGQCSSDSVASGRDEQVSPNSRRLDFIDSFSSLVLSFFAAAADRYRCY